MRRAITIGYRHGKGSKPVVLAGPEIPHATHKAELKALRVSRAHEEFERIEVWTSAGARRLRFLTPEANAKREATLAKAAEPPPPATEGTPEPKVAKPKAKAKAAPKVKAKAAK